MRQFSVLLLISLLVSMARTPVSAQSGAKARVRYDYMLYVPKDYASSNAAYPLVIYLHGGSQRGNDLNKLKTYGFPQLIAQGRDFPFIIAAPQCPNEKYWSTENWLDLLYDEVSAKYRIDPRRVYLTGISMGGYGTWQTAVDYPDRFAAIAPLCGGLDDSTQVCRIKNVPVWAFHGTADDVIPFTETERLVRQLNQCNGNVTFSRLANERHAIQYLYEDKKLYDWLLKQRK